MKRSLILKWLHDETFYSLCVRHQRFFGLQFPETPIFTALGAGWRAPRHDFPCRLSNFDTLAISEIGSSQEIIRDHTILPFFAPFQSQDNVQKSINAMKSDSIGSIKYRLGLIASKYGAEHPLKFCAACAREDTEKYGVAYWHVSHQYPGSLLCLVHKTKLIISSKKRKWSAPHSWVLPNDESNNGADERTLLPVENALAKISESAIDLAKAGFDLTYEPNLVAATYRAQIKHLHESDDTTGDFEASLLGYFNLLAPFHPFDALPRDVPTLRTMLQHLTRTPRAHSHPLKHLALLNWLFGSLRSFTAAYSEVKRNHQRPIDEIRAAQQYFQRTAAPKPLNISRGAPRPKVLKGGVKSEVLERLSEGADKAEICACFGVTISTVNKLLRSAPEAKAGWVKASFEKCLEVQRSKWLSTQQHYPCLGAKALRALAPATYAWLYRNDKQWLLLHTTLLPTGRHGNNSNIDWDARDRELQAAVRGEVARMKEAQPGAYPSREHLLMQLPRLAACLEKRDRYPQTRRLLSVLQEETVNKASKGAPVEIKLLA